MTTRLTITAAIAVVTASFSLYTVIGGSGWLAAGIGAVAVVAVAGALTRLAAPRSAIAATVVTAMAATPLFAAAAWQVKLVGLALVALVAASASGLRFLSALASLATYLGAVLLYLNLVFAHAQSMAHVLPTAASLNQLGNLYNQGFAGAAFSPPVADILGISLLAAAGMGLVAVVVDVIAVRLGHPAIAGLPLLALFSVPITTALHHVGVAQTVAFALAVAGYLAMLSTKERDRLRAWGRLVTVWQSPVDEAEGRRPDTRALTASGRRVGLVAVCLAALLPLAVPGVRIRDLFRTTKTPGQVIGAGVLLTPVVQMERQLLSTKPVPVLVYTSSTDDAQDQYLQVYTLNYNPSKGQWTLAGTGASTKIVAGRSLPSPPGLTASRKVTTTTLRIRTSANNAYAGAVTALAVPYAPQRIDFSGARSNRGPVWLASDSSLEVYTTASLAQLTYTVRSEVPADLSNLGSEALLPAAIRDNYLAVPSTDRGELLRIARRHTRGASTTLAKALALQNWLNSTGGFTYSLHPSLPANPVQALVKFLTTERRGYCQQFAFAMATLARELGIPSRIEVGYTPGTKQANGSWLVTTADAHAWPELYFPGAGWLRFEPTPAGAAGQGTAEAPAYTTTPPSKAGTHNSSGGGPTAPPLLGKGPGKLPAGLRGGLHQQGGPGSTLASPGRGASPAGWIGIGLAALVALALAAPRLARSLTRRRRWRRAATDAERAHVAWLELTDDLADHGVPVRPSDTPRALAVRLAAGPVLDPLPRRSLDHLCDAVEQARYAKSPRTTTAGQLRDDVTVVRRAVSASAPWSRRWRARLLPTSAIAPAREAGQHALDVFGWLDASPTRRRASATS